MAGVSAKKIQIWHHLILVGGGGGVAYPFLLHTYETRVGPKKVLKLIPSRQRPGEDNKKLKFQIFPAFFLVSN